MQCCFQATNKPIKETSAQTDDSAAGHETLDEPQVEKSGDVCVVQNEVVTMACNVSTQTSIVRETAMPAKSFVPKAKS